MKKIFFCLAVVFLSGCDLFPGKIGKVSISPKSDITTRGSYILSTGNEYHLFSKIYCNDPYPENVFIDTLTVEGKLYQQVFFVRIIPENLDKDFKNLNMTPCSLREIYSKGDTIRKQMPGFSERKFLVVENVVGVK
jgi:hypothetical protein